MDALFPFGFPPATALYLTLYVLTLVLHVVFMNYVLAGSAMIAWVGLRRGTDLPQPNTQPATPTAILIDWLPAMLSGAITAAVAPLLFVQILYKQEFYTANLLLFNRWMSILPVLILGFYALYLLRGDWLRRRGSWAVALGALVPLLCIAFTGYSWTENHLLSVRGQRYWAQFYTEGVQFYFEPQLIPRLALWTFGSLPTLALLLGWQVWLYRRKGATVVAGTDRSLAWLALVGMVLAGMAWLAWLPFLPPEGILTMNALAGSVWDSSMLPQAYVGVAVVGIALQTAAWWSMRRGVTVAALWLASAGLLLAVIGMTVFREIVRLETLGRDRIAELYKQHDRAGQVGGFWVFLFFFAVNAGVVVYCFLLVQRGRVPAQETSEPTKEKPA